MSPCRALFIVIGILLGVQTVRAATFGHETEVGPQVSNVTGQYIVTLMPGADVFRHHEHVQAILGADLAGITHRYSLPGYQAYAGQFDDAALQKLAHLSDVLHISHDGIVTPQELDPGSSCVSTACMKAKLTTQKPADWGLHHISHRTRAALPGTYIYSPTAGTGTFSYVLDSGINPSNPEFEKRASHGYNAVKGTKPIDNANHGTFVAGLIGGKTWGVAKRTSLISVKIFDKISTTDSIFLDGFVWAVNDIVKKKRQAKAVINISLSTSRTAAIDAAVNAAAKSGVTTVACAGNYGADAGEWSPGSAEGAITVSAVDEAYKSMKNNNYGPKVALFAPGVAVRSCIGSRKGTAVKSGTSFAAPYVAGLVVYLKSLQSLPDAVATRVAILKLATSGLVDDPKGAKNLMAYNGSGA